MIKESLPTVMPQVAYGLISAKDHDTVTERVYWGDHLIALELVTDGTAQERQNRLRAAIISARIQAGGAALLFANRRGAKLERPRVHVPS